MTNKHLPPPSPDHLVIELLKQRGLIDPNKMKSRVDILDALIMTLVTHGVGSEDAPAILGALIDLFKVEGLSRKRVLSQYEN